MNDPAKRYVLDTSALLTFTDSEDGVEVIDALLSQAQKGELELLVSFASWMGVYYIYLQEQGREHAQLWISKLKRLPLVRVDSDEIAGQIAGELKASHRMSFADAWIAALPKRHGAILVHKNPEFESASRTIQLQALPYRQIGGRYCTSLEVGRPSRSFRHTLVISPGCPFSGSINCLSYS